MNLPALRGWRTVLPAAAFFATLALLAKYSYPLPDYTKILLWWTRLDPFLLLAQLRSGSVPDWVWLPVTTLLLTILAGRFFCGWLCPLGGLLAIINSLKPKAPPNWSHRLNSFRTPWLLFLLGILLLGSSWTIFLTPFHLLTEGLSRLWRQQAPWLLLLIVLSAITIFPRFWCVYLCPTGLLFSFISRWRIFRASPPINCVQCGACEKICPTAAAIPAEGKTTQDCLLCGRCSEVCPVGQFDLSPSPLPTIEGKDMKTAFTRREILRSGGALILAGAASPLLARPTGANPLRPPGALEETEFLTSCSRCGRCIKVCPSQCIQPMSLQAGAAMFLTPQIIPRQSRCELCQQCQQVCPTGAVAQIPIPQTLIGLAIIDHKRCLGWSEGKLCLVCKEQCPQHAIDSDPLHRPSVQKNLCVGCGGCENACPIDPAAIVVIPQSKRRHR
jgi:polyferredoxin